MRKIIVEMDPNFVSKFVAKEFFDSFMYIEGNSLIRYDFEKGEEIGIFDVQMKPGFALNDLKFPTGFTILNILRKIGNKYTCLFKMEFKGTLMKILKRFNVEDIIYDLPYILSEKKFVISFIGDNRMIKKVLKALKTLGIIRNISVQKATFTEFNILSCLTDRQKEIILLAKKNGYYKFPRKITAGELAKKLGISKTTTIEHLRKAENRIISCNLAGY